MKLNNLVIIGVAATTVASCAPSKKEYCLLYTSDAADE